MDYRNTVVCWGDSITEGMGMRDRSYPTILGELLGDDYKVINAGDGGEDTITIMARQGALKLFTENDIVFGKSEESVAIGNQDNNGFITADNEKIKLTALLGNELPVNDITICGEKFTLDLKGFSWTPITYTAVLKRKNADKVLKIPKNSQVFLNNTDIAQKGGIDIYLMGANGGFDKSAEKLVCQFKKMIAHHGNDRFIIIVPFWSPDYDELLTEEFGEHLVYFRKEACENGLDYEGLTPTEEDKERIILGRTPPSLCYKNKPDVHLNEHGYHLLGNLVYAKGKELGCF